MYSPALVARLCLALLCLSPMNLAHAAPTPGETDLIRERQDRLLEEQRRRLEELKELPGKAAKPILPAAPADTRCFPIKDIELKGADSLSDSEKNRLLKPYIGQCLGVTQLNELLKVITNHYIEKGLVTSRAYLQRSIGRIAGRQTFTRKPRSGHCGVQSGPSQPSRPFANCWCSRRSGFWWKYWYWRCRGGKCNAIQLPDSSGV